MTSVPQPHPTGSAASDADPRSTRDRVLDAAEDVLSRGGPVTLTLDAVAAAAGVSKGGLLHYFGSKEALVFAMAHRAASEWRSEVLAAIERTPEGPGRVARALLETCDLTDACWTEQIRRRSAALFAVLLHRPDLISELRSPCDEVRQWLSNDGLAEGVGEAVLAAIDGVWMYWVTGLMTLDDPALRRIRAALGQLIQLGITAAPGEAPGDGGAHGR